MGDTDVTEVLLAAGATPHARDRDGDTAVHRATALGHLATLGALLSRNGDATAPNNAGITPLMIARTADVVDSLCRAGASTGATTAEGDTALHRAAAAGRSAVVRALLAHGADPNAANHLGEAALHHAALVADTHGGTACLELLLDAGAHVDEETNDGVTPLMVAARRAHLSSVQLLLARGARVNATTVTGNTALIMASDGRNGWTRDFSFGDRMEACLRALADAGADVNAANDEGITPLHAAAWGFDAGPVRVLLALGADPNRAARDGLTPLAVAAQKGHDAMQEALVAAGARAARTGEPSRSDHR
jgi:ankyrin